MKMSEKMKAMTPEEKAAWKKKMSDSKAAKAAARVAAGSPVVVGKAPKKPKSQPAAPAPAAPAPAKKKDDDDGEGWLL